MAPSKSAPTISVPGTRARVLAAAERLLAVGRPEFTMRDLAAEAGVSFATPFNQFGSKGAIMHALSAERIAAMHARYAASAPFCAAPARVLAAVEIAAAVMLERAAVNRAVMGALGAPSPEPHAAPGEVQGQVWTRSRALWAEALGDGDGFADPALARRILPDQLAIMFRGTLSFWSAGEIADAQLMVRTRMAAAALLFGFAEPGACEDLVAAMTAPSLPGS